MLQSRRLYSMLLAQKSDDDLCTSTCFRRAQAPVWPKQHKHANKNLSFILQVGISHWPLPTPWLVHCCALQHKSACNKEATETQTCKGFHKFFFFSRAGAIIFQSDVFDRLCWQMEARCSFTSGSATFVNYVRKSSRGRKRRLVIEGDAEARSRREQANLGNFKTQKLAWHSEWENLGGNTITHPIQQSVW